MIGELDDYKDLVVKCSHCALCEAICPVYLEDMLETHVARARVDIIDQTLCKKTMPVTPRVKDIINRCLLCTSCTRECGAAVPVHEIIIAARHALYGGKRQNWLKRYILKNMIENRGIVGLPAYLLWTAQQLHLTPAGFPSIILSTFTSKYRGTYPASSEKRQKVAYFVGCATNSMDPETGESVMRVLAHNGIEVVVPDKLMCCGIPALAEGDMKSAQNAVRNNIAILADLDVDAVVTDCTSCGMMLRAETGKVLPADDPLLKKAAELAPKIFEVTDYLNKIGLSPAPTTMQESYTYHMPCHRGWTPTLDTAPIEVLSCIPGMEYHAMSEPGKCCGAGGAFFTEYEDLSGKIRKRKLDDILSTGVKTVISQCPGCRSYLASALGRKTRVIHPVTLLRKAYGL
jgi:glycolate oxidase iron-sulfur subunit